jgi:hypothetical protein
MSYENWGSPGPCPAVSDEPTAVTVIEADMQEFRELATQFHKFLNNDFRHLVAEVAYVKGQLKIILMVMGIIAVAVVGLAVQEVLK